MFECMFDRSSQHPPTDTVKKRERRFHTTGTRVASDAFRLAFLCIVPASKHHQRERDILDQLSGSPAGATSATTPPPSCHGLWAGSPAESTESRRDTGCVSFIERVASREVYRNPWLVLREDDIRRADGSHGIYSVVDKPTYALVMPYDGQRFRLVEQFRYPLGARRWEFPQGNAPGLGDLEPTELAARELREETGLRATSFEALGLLDVAAGMTSQRGWVFLATGISEGDSDREHEEQDMRSEWFGREDVEEMIRSGVLADAQSVAAYGLFLLSDQSHL
jgi:8-oxo-dGDP phosphatase